ncbi:MAG: hypothetical protein K6G85_03910, partial [Eubacterium sp.]|nr:hypothetical protein [Eubacterium sp.]
MYAERRLDNEINIACALENALKDEMKKYADKRIEDFKEKLGNELKEMEAEMISKVATKLMMQSEADPFQPTLHIKFISQFFFKIF